MNFTQHRPRTYADCQHFAQLKYGIEWYKTVCIIRSKQGRTTEMWILKAIKPVLTQQCQKQGNRLLGN